MSRPTQKIDGSKLSLEVPAGWHVIFAAISRKDYNQVIKVYNTITREDDHLASEHGKILETMKDLVTGEDSLAIGAKLKPMRLDFEWFYSTNTNLSGHERANISKTGSKSEVIQVRSVPRPPKTPASIPDFITYMVFVEDTLGHGAGDHGIYDDGVATIHCVKKTDNAQDDDDDDD
ncbi:hypothetical protein BD779DRAFT_1803167 [Infundibulicybe gibba]|nr:hypothetical protein BD779DRAFT_1803167 [Infundibulicybe gibba]